MYSYIIQYEISILQALCKVFPAGYRPLEDWQINCCLHLQAICVYFNRQWLLNNNELTYNSWADIFVYSRKEFII